MKEFYEPMLYLSTPDHPNTMGVLVKLKESVDGAILRGVVDHHPRRCTQGDARVADRT